MDTRVKPAYDDLNPDPSFYAPFPAFFNFRRVTSPALGRVHMDMMSMVTSLLAAKAGNTQMQVAATIMKSNADAEKSAAMTLLGTGSPQANLGAGVGGNLDISA